MRNWILAVFGAATMVVPAHAQTIYDEERVLYRVSSHDLRAIAERMGYKAKVHNRIFKDFVMSVTTPDDEPLFSIKAEKCTQTYANCATVRLRDGIPAIAGLTTEIVNELNNEFIPKISIEEIQDTFGVFGGDYEAVRIETHHVMDRGMTMGNLRVNISVFLRELAKIRPKLEFIGSHVAETIGQREVLGLIGHLGFSGGEPKPAGNSFQISVQTPSSQPDFYVWAEDCEKKFAGCKTMQLWASFAPRDGLTLETINSLNIQFSAKTSLENNPGGAKRVRVKSRHRLESGVTMSNLKANVEAYLSDLAAIRSRAGR